MLLRRLDGFEPNASTVLIAATNRPQVSPRCPSPPISHLPSPSSLSPPGLCPTPRISWQQDLDAALVSRFELTVHFPLPDQPTRRAILELYAKHLQDAERADLAAAAQGASGRDLRDVCEAAERRWAARRVRQESVAKARLLPPVDEYRAALRERLAADS